MRASVATLIGELITYDEIGQAVREPVEREIMCEVSSVTRNEWSAASAIGIDPKVKLITPLCNYNGESLILFEGEKYAIYRTFCKSDIIELYLERKAGKH